MRCDLFVLLLGTIVAMNLDPAHGQVAPTSPATRPARDQQQVPVKDVVLFTSGVGYFEHFGTVQGNANTELSFKSAQINDILKSLLLEDMDGGKVSVVTYASQEPIERTLKSFEVDLNDNPSLAQILTQLRGSSVTAAVTGSAPVTGQILGVESKQKPATPEGKTVEVFYLNLLLPAGTIRPLQLDQLTEIRLDDPKLQQELVKALGAVAASRDQDKKPVTLRFNGEGQRRVRVGYVVEAPVWKASYRLVIASDAKNEQVGEKKEDAGTGGHADAGKEQAEGQAKPADGGKLQGWAIIENQTDNDWEGVQLSLVSGRPISFIEDLYQPLYVPRPVVQPQLYASLRPQTYETGIEQETLDRLAEKAAPANAPRMMGRARASQSGGLFGSSGSAGGGFGGAGRASSGALAAAADRPIDAASSVSALASGAKVGELFQYTVPDVSLPRQKSAMIPILADGVKVRRLSIYNANVLATNPLLGARLVNTTGKLLPQGPLTVLDGGVYAGDAKIDDLPNGQDRLLSYGIDQQVIVQNKDQTGNSHLVTAKIIKGALELTSKQEVTQKYVAENKGKTDRMLLIEHPKRQGWTLAEPAKPMESTDALYRFEQALPAGKAQSFTVREEITTSQQMAILPMDTGTLDVYIKTGPIPQKVKDALAKATQMKYAIGDTQRQVALHQQQIGELNQDQSRIRENMKTVAQTTDYYKKLLNKLDEQETLIEKLQSEMKQLQQKEQQQQKDLESYLSTLDVG